MKIWALLLHFFIFSLFFWGFNSSAELSRPLTSEQVKKLEKNVLENPNNLNSRRFLADHFALQSDWKMVAQYLSPVAESLPTKYIHLLVNAYIQQKQIREAESIIRIPLSGKKVSEDTYLLAARVYAEKMRAFEATHHADEAKEALFELLKVAQQTYPQSSTIYDAWLSYLEEFVAHYQYEALKVIDDMVTNKMELNDRHASLLCKFNHMAGYTKQTKETCEAAIERNPNDPSNYIYLGQTHIDTGDTDKGMRMLSSVGKKFSQSEEALWAAGNAYYENKNLPMAYDYYKKAILHKNAQARDYLGYAKVSFELKKYDEALQAFDKHCLMTKTLDQEFRRASGLLKEGSAWKERYRQKMSNCTKK